MISDTTKTQLAALEFDTAKPLVICDVDEVVVHFIAEFEKFVEPHGLRLQPSNPALPYIVRHHATAELASTALVSDHIEKLFETRTQNMEPIIGAVEGLKTLSKSASVVMLTNLSDPAYREAARRLGAYAYLDKSREFDELPGIIKTLSELLQKDKLL